MDFEVSDGTGDALDPGDRVRFALRTGSARSWIEGIAITRHGEAPAGTRPATASVVRLLDGDAVPPLTLVDDDGAPVTADDFAGRLTVLTFVFTRCPVPDYCPLVSRRFVQVQAALEADRSLPRDVWLLSITIDPEFDTPPVLKAYARARGADPARWRFAGGDPRRYSAWREPSRCTSSGTARCSITRWRRRSSTGAATSSPSGGATAGRSRRLSTPFAGPAPPAVSDRLRRRRAGRGRRSRRLWRVMSGPGRSSPSRSGCG